MNRKEFSDLVESARKATCEDNKLPGRDQHRTNRFGIHLSWLWACNGHPGKRSNVYFYAARHNSHLKKIEPVIRRAKAHVCRFEFLTDVFVEKYYKKQRTVTTLLAAEIEASPNHSVKYGYDGPRRSDYLWDFSKLLYVRAPKRLFVGCTVKTRMKELICTLARGYSDANCLADASGETAVVLLPGGTTERTEVQLGLANSGHRLEFAPL
jgi:hypothetical protein